MIIFSYLRCICSLVKACYCLEMYGQILSSWTGQIHCVWWTDIKHLLVLKWTFNKEQTGKVQTTFQIPFHLGSLMRTVFCQLNHQVVQLDSVGFPILSMKAKVRLLNGMRDKEPEYFPSPLCFRLYLWQQVNSTATTPKRNVHCGSFFLDSSGLWWCFFSLFCHSLGKVTVLSSPLILKLEEEITILQLLNPFH